MRRNWRHNADGLEDEKPREAQNKLHRELVKIANLPEIKAKMGDEVMLVALGPAELRKHATAETERWRRITIEKNIKLETN